MQIKVRFDCVQLGGTRTYSLDSVMYWYFDVLLMLTSPEANVLFLLCGLCHVVQPLYNHIQFRLKYPTLPNTIMTDDKSHLFFDIL